MRSCSTVRSQLLQEGLRGDHHRSHRRRGRHGETCPSMPPLPEQGGTLQGFGAASIEQWTVPVEALHRVEGDDLEATLTAVARIRMAIPPRPRPAAAADRRHGVLSIPEIFTRRSAGYTADHRLLRGPAAPACAGGAPCRVASPRSRPRRSSALVVGGPLPRRGVGEAWTRLPWRNASLLRAAFSRWGAAALTRAHLPGLGSTLSVPRGSAVTPDAEPRPCAESRRANARGSAEDFVISVTSGHSAVCAAGVYSKIGSMPDELAQIGAIVLRAHGSLPAR